MKIKSSDWQFIEIKYEKNKNSKRERNDRKIKSCDWQFIEGRIWIWWRRLRQSRHSSLHLMPRLFGTHFFNKQSSLPRLSCSYSTTVLQSPILDSRLFVTHFLNKHLGLRSKLYGRWTSDGIWRFDPILSLHSGALFQQPTILQKWIVLTFWRLIPRQARVGGPGSPLSRPVEQGYWGVGQ